MREAANMLLSSASNLRSLREYYTLGSVGQLSYS